MPAKYYEITFDGGALGNPGKGYGSYLIKADGIPREVARLEYSQNGELVTNNQAEYRTLLAALRAVLDDVGPDASDVAVNILGDSKLVIEQLSGRWKVKNADLQVLHAQGVKLLKQFKRATLTWHGRSNSVSVLGH